MGTVGTAVARAADQAYGGLPADGAITRAGARSGGHAEGDARATTRGAVIIPAHDEAAVIGRTLRALAPLTRCSEVEIVVACNGCRDDTAEIARGFAGVTVVETDEASKAAGLNLGDRAATAWPRLYLDADIEVDPAAVAAVFAELAEPGVLAARPRFVYDVSGASLPVRAYYRARARITAPARRMWGAGGYATNAAGHSRFAAFPALTADDCWFDALFADEEKRVVATEGMRVRTPRDVHALLAVLTRQHRGHVQASTGDTAAARVRSLIGGIRRISEATDAAWYIGLTAWTRLRVARAARRDAGAVWERDLSSRGIPGVVA